MIWRKIVQIIDDARSHSNLDPPEAAQQIADVISRAFGFLNDLAQGLRLLVIVLVGVFCICIFTPTLLSLFLNTLHNLAFNIRMNRKESL